MKELKFKTTIMCGNCLGKATPILDNIPEIENWGVDLTSDDHILSVQTQADITEKIISELLSIGYKAESIK